MVVRVLCAEKKEDMYRFVVDFIKKHAPGLSLDTVRVVSVDQFLNQDMIADFGFVNTTFVINQWHLVEKGLEEHFGRSGKDLLMHHLNQMIQSLSAKTFEETIKAAKQLLVSQEKCDGNLEDKFEEFFSKKNITQTIC